MSVLNTNNNGTILNASVEERNEWTRTNWIEQVITDFRTGDIIGFILNNGSQLTETELVQLLRKESTGSISVRNNWDMSFMMEIKDINGYKYAGLSIKFPKSELDKVSDIYIKGYCSGITLGEADNIAVDGVKGAGTNALLNAINKM